MTHADSVTDLAAIALTWPQAVVALGVIFALVMWPNIVTMVTASRTATRLKNVEEKAEIAAHEVRPNSGKSLADSANRTEAAVHELSRKLDGHIAEAKVRDERIEALERRRFPFWARR